MTHCTLSLCAEGVVNDRATNNISVFNICESLGAAAFPVILPKLVALFMLKRDATDPERLECRVVFSSAGQETAAFPVDVNFQGGLGHRSITIIEGIVIPGPGLFRASLHAGDRELGAWEIEVRQLEVPKPRIPEAQPAQQHG